MAADRFIGLALLALAASALVAPVPAGAASPPSAAKKGVSAADAMAAGVRAFEQGKPEAAVSRLSTAIGAGGLESQQLAKALFYRGVAHRKQGHVAAALSDLTAALWLRNGLSATDRAVAEDHRRALYRDAGSTEPAAPPRAPAAEAAVIAPLPPLAAPPLAPERPRAPAIMPAVATVTPAVSPPWQTTAIGSATPPVAEAPLPWAHAGDAGTPQAPATVMPVERAALVPVHAAPAPPPPVPSWETAALPSVPKTPEAPLAWPAAAHATPSPSTVSTSTASVTDPSSQHTPTSTVAGLFGKLFSGSVTPPPEAEAAPAVVASPSPAAGARPPQAIVSAPPAATLTSPPPVAVTVPSAAADPSPQHHPTSTVADLFGNSFSGSATPSPQTPSAPIQTAALRANTQPPATPPANTVWSATALRAEAPSPPLPPTADAGSVASAPGGPYHLLLASAATRAEAEDTMQRFLAKHATTLRGRATPSIEDPRAGGGSIFSGMGSGYRLTIGPYSTAVEPGRLCNILRPHGFDCEVIRTQTDG